MSKTFKIVGNDISDGYHTFDELYEHRCLLFINLVLLHDYKYWVRDHIDGWDLIVWDSPAGQISYHVPRNMRPLFETKIAERLSYDHTWDGHTSNDVIFRLRHCALKAEK